MVLSLFVYSGLSLPFPCVLECVRVCLHVQCVYVLCGLPLCPQSSIINLRLLHHFEIHSLKEFLFASSIYGCVEGQSV